MHEYHSSPIAKLASIRAQASELRKEYELGI
jgi:hypothetical protein